MADCYVNNTIFEIKAPEGKTTDCIQRMIFVNRKREVIDINDLLR